MATSGDYFMATDTVEVLEQFDVAPPVDVPVVLMGGGILGGDEYQVGVQPVSDA